MPKNLRSISLFAIGAAVFGLLFIVLGPKQGMEALGGVLVAYFVLLFHIAIGPAYLLHVYRAGRVSLAVGAMLAYLLVIYSIGLYVYVVASDIDDAVVDRLEQRADPAGYRMRELGESLYREQVMRHPLPRPALDELSALVQQVAEVNERDRAHMPILWYAAVLGQAEIVEALLRKGAVVEDEALFTSPPVYAATQNDHLAVVQILLRAGADPDASAPHGEPALAIAVKSENLPMIGALLAAGGDANLGSPPPLFHALRQQRSDIVSLLLGHGAEPSEFMGKTPMALAIENRDQGSIDALNATGGGFDEVIGDRDPILFDFIPRCDLESFSKYLGHGASPNAINRRGNTLLREVTLLDFKRCDFDAVRDGFSTLR